MDSKNYLPQARSFLLPFLLITNLMNGQDYFPIHCFGVDYNSLDISTCKNDSTKIYIQLDLIFSWDGDSILTQTDFKIKGGIILGNGMKQSMNEFESSDYLRKHGFSIENIVKDVLREYEFKIYCKLKPGNYKQNFQFPVCYL
tara:strand:- start:37 stop:465 length:429 start_codon:yes stop_codon:yes gene_type:complete